jgi:hypothetical protein
METIGIPAMTSKIARATRILILPEVLVGSCDSIDPNADAPDGSWKLTVGDTGLAPAAAATAFATSIEP